MGRRINWTDDMKKFIYENYFGRTAKELAEMVNGEFGTDITHMAVKGFRKRNGLRCGFDGRFKKGQVSHNKGKPMSSEIYKKVKATMFTKGHRPVNYRPVGSERVTADGYIEIKVADPNIWRQKHRFVWEQANGPVPDGYAVFILDGNKQNCELSNLKLVKRSEILIMSRHRLFQKSAELNDVASNLARMIDVSNSAKKERNRT